MEKQLYVIILLIAIGIIFNSHLFYRFQKKKTTS